MSDNQPFNASITDSVIFRDIFGTEDMRRIWSDQHRTQRYLDVEAALAKTQGQLGLIPADAATEIASKCQVANFDFTLLKQRTELIGYPVLPVVEQLTALCRDGLGQWSHWGATTQDITDTASVLQIRDSLAVMEADLAATAAAAATLTLRHRDTLMMGRSNLQQAVPITFGFKMGEVLAALRRHQARLQELKPRLGTLEFGGACGTLASLGTAGLAVQEGMAKELDLAVPEIAWHTHRDRIAEVGCWLGLLTGTLAKVALDVKLLMQTEVGEVSEPFVPGRGTSSTMPQKRNPISCCYITANAAVVRQYVAALLNAMVEDHERATGTWEIEWVVLPAIFTAAAGALAQAKFMLSGLEVHADKMRANVDLTQGLVMSEAVMMALGPKIGREKAHNLLSPLCTQAANEHKPLLDLLVADPTISQQFDRAALEKIMDPAQYLGIAGETIDRLMR